MIVSIEKDVYVDDYDVAELVLGVQFLVVKSGELDGRQFPIWTGGIIPGYTVRVRFYQERGWRTLWLRRRGITAWDCRLTEETPEQVQRKLCVIYDNLSFHADPLGLS